MYTRVNCRNFHYLTSKSGHSDTKYAFLCDRSKKSIYSEHAHLLETYRPHRSEYHDVSEQSHASWNSEPSHPDSYVVWTITSWSLCLLNHHILIVMSSEPSHPDNYVSKLNVQCLQCISCQIREIRFVGVVLPEINFLFCRKCAAVVRSKYK